MRRTTCVDYPGSYVADIIRTCEMYRSFFGWTRANGVDNLVACFERAVPNYSVYFSSRSPDPSNFRESAAEPSAWNRTNIRKLWRKNLYGENYSAPDPGDPPPDPDPPPPGGCEDPTEIICSE